MIGYRGIRRRHLFPSADEALAGALDSLYNAAPATNVIRILREADAS